MAKAHVPVVHNSRLRDGTVISKHSKYLKLNVSPSEGAGLSCVIETLGHVTGLVPRGTGSDSDVQGRKGYLLHTLARRTVVCKPCGRAVHWPERLGASYLPPLYSCWL